MIICENLVKIYQVAEIEVVALQGLDLTVAQGEFLAIVGASGSGKSTLLNVLGALDRPSAGRVLVDGRDLLKLPDSELDRYRRHEVGFVWQQTTRNLIPYLSAQANVELPMAVAGMGGREKRAWTRELLEAVGLWEHRQHRPVQLSGGQQQRVAIAVALANKPRLLLADEPTGEVDSATAADILALLRQMNRQYGLTTILVTHDPQVAGAVDRVVTIRDGRTSSEAVRRVADVEAALAGAATPQPGAFEEYVVVDAAGRLQVPPDLRQQVGLDSRATVSLSDGTIVIRPVADGRGRERETTAVVDEVETVTSGQGQSRWRTWLSRLRRSQA
jgi:ABC-type lipoprotein export system ATPase subunit